MTAKFNIQITLNGWVIPFDIERHGKGVFKVAYRNAVLGHLLLTEKAKWYYINYSSQNLLNKITRTKITEAIVNY